MKNFAESADQSLIKRRVYKDYSENCESSIEKKQQTMQNTPVICLHKKLAQHFLLHFKSRNEVDVIKTDVNSVCR